MVKVIPQIPTPEEMVSAVLHGQQPRSSTAAAPQLSTNQKNHYLAVEKQDEHGSSFRSQVYQLGRPRCGYPADTGVLLPRAELLSSPDAVGVSSDLLLGSLTWLCSLPCTDMPVLVTHIPSTSYKRVSNIRWAWHLCGGVQVEGEVIPPPAVQHFEKHE